MEKLPFQIIKASASRTSDEDGALQETNETSRKATIRKILK